jgi:hypothetical protein
VHNHKASGVVDGGFHSMFNIILQHFQPQEKLLLLRGRGGRKASKSGNPEIAMTVEIRKITV